MIDGLPKRIHSVGAGGAGMLPLTLYLADSGHEVSAEDDAWGEEALALLQARGVALQAFDEGEIDVAVVYSSAISADHPARVFARRTGSVAMRRGECLAVIARGKKLIAVAGSHGKTTTCGMLVDLFAACGQEVDFVLGAQYVEGLPYRACGSEWLVAEIDESDGTIDLFTPTIGVLLNADHDHHARYPTFDDYWSAFDRMLRRTRGFVIADASLRGRVESSSDWQAQFEWIGADDRATGRVSAREVGPGWTEIETESESGVSRFSINRIGTANAMNAAFALAAGKRAGLELPNGAQIEFRAIRRRQRCYYCSPSLSIYEDYAHHPTEIDAVLAQLNQTVRNRKTITVFQPHRYSRTKELKDGFAQSLKRCDKLVLLDVYAASETPLEGGRGEDLLAACRAVGIDCELVAREALFPALDALSQTGEYDRVAFIGAGVGDRLGRGYAAAKAKLDTRWGKVFQSLGESGGFSTRIVAGEPLAAKTTLRVGGPAEMYIEPATLAELLAVLRSCHAQGIKVYPLGRGSNLVVPDEGVEGLVIRLSHPRWCRYENRGDGSLLVGAGLRIKTLCGQACRDGLAGFEFLEGIPGSVGGVLRMNAGAMGGWAFDVVESVRYVTLDGVVHDVKRESMDFGYRYCRELESAIAVEATLRSGKEPAPSEELRRRVEAYQDKRRETQPREPSAGCIFKNPDGDSAGRIVDQLGLKGAVVGGAEISVTHGNFVINRGGATAADVIELVGFARRVAKERRGVELHPEALLFGSSWERVLS